MQNIPLVDLKRQCSGIQNELNYAVRRVMDSGDFILGQEVSLFENEFAGFIGSGYCVGVASGTDALLLALRALDIGRGDEVIVPANTFIATALAVSLAGAKPVFADCRPDNYTIDFNSADKCVSSKTKAIIPVHLYGNPCDMDAAASFASEYGLRIIEDAAQAHGAEFNGRKCGTFGDIGCFSFYPGKNLGALGDGGAIVTDNQEIYSSVKLLRNYGQSKKYSHDILGYNSRLDSIQAAILRVKLPYLDRWNSLRAEAARRYSERLSMSGLSLPSADEHTRHAWHLYVIQSDDRDGIAANLSRCGIAHGIHYPTPVPLQKAYSGMDYGPCNFSVANRLASRILSLPLFPEITDDEISRVCAAVTGSSSTT